VKRKILFVDRDGTLIEEPADEQVDRIDKVRLKPGVIAALQGLADSGYEFVMVSNQDGLGTDSFPQADFDAPHAHMLALFESQGITFSETFICPHLPADGCDCRKPRTGLVAPFLARTPIDTAASAVIGDRESDLSLAENIGLRGFLLDDSKTWDDVRAELTSRARTAAARRTTRETDIALDVNLDRAGDSRIDTGIGFFDHMLEQVSKHAGFSLRLACRGDLGVDEHHSVEDVALALGGALREALGDKRGIGRYGFVLPMDESLAQVAIDISGRPAFRFNGTFPRDAVGGMSIEMVEHFFASLAQSLGAAIHIDVSGDNTHHMVEACFKGVGRALRPALARSGADLPSTKGML
jgi:imidazoleglycerol-phosphate dehydratase/histidinol-phosphatase